MTVSLESEGRCSIWDGYVATTGQARASGAVAGDGLPELKARVDRMIPGRETTPPECKEAVFQSRLVYNMVYMPYPQANWSNIRHVWFRSGGRYRTRTCDLLRVRQAL